MELFSDFLGALKEIFFDYPPLGAICAVLVVIVILMAVTVIASLILSELFKIIDTYSRPKKIGQGKVIDKNVTDIKQMGVITICTIQNILIEIDGRLCQTTVNKRKYESIKKSDYVDVVYVTGRLFGHIYLKEVDLK